MSKQQPRAGARSPVIHHWYSGTDVVDVAEGDGAYVYDGEGREYLDFVSQLYCVNAGHSQQRIVDAITEQAERIPYVASAKGSDVRTELAERLVDVAPDSLSDVYFAISGSEANESAVQMAREYTDASKVLTRWRSYHGSTYGAASLTGDPSTRAAMETHAATSGSVKFLPPMTYRSPFDGETPEEVAEQAADHLEFVIRNEGPDSVAAVMMEPIAGSSGAYTAPPTYFERVRELCDEYDVLMISDEVICGFGRCGDWFGVQTEGVDPDLLTFAKGVTSAYVPLAGVLASEAVADHIREKGHDLGQTFAGHPLGCAAGLATLDLYEDGLLERVRRLEPTLRDALTSLADDHDVVGDVRGRGFLWAVEFTDPETGEPFYDPWVDDDDADNPVETVHDVAQSEGVLLGMGRPGFQLMLSPPFCIDEDDVETAVSALDRGIEAAFY